MFRFTFRFSNYSAIAAAAAALSFVTTPATASQAVQQVNQQEQRDGYGRITVESSVITVVNCNGAGENGGQYYIYQYVNRPGVRAIRPPYWAQAIGGRDWANYGQAVAAACGNGNVSGPASGNLSGVWRLATNCGFTNPAWTATVNLSEDANGALSATVTDDKLGTSMVGPDPAPNSWGSKMRSQVSGNVFSLLLHPNGWVSVLELTGTVNGSRIDGRIHHYTTDDCSFTMVR